VATNAIYQGGCWWDAGINSNRMAVFKSTNDGSSWIRTYLSPDTGQVSSLEIQPTNSNVLLAGGFTMNASYYRYSRMYRSTNAGATWTQVGASVLGSTYEYITAIAWDLTVANRVLAGTSSGLYVSTDAGATWSLLKSSMSAYDLVADPGERRDLALNHPEIVQRLTSMAASFGAGIEPVMKLPAASRSIISGVTTHAPKNPDKVPK